MPRNPLGRAKRSVVVSVRITEDEAAELESVYGTKEKAFQAFHSNWKEGRKSAKQKA